MLKTRTTLKPALLLSSALLLALACGGGRDGRTVAIEPEAPAVLVGETLALSAHPQADLGGDVEWEVKEAYGGGLLQSQGLRVTYVPPEAAGTYHLVLRGTGRDGRPFKQDVEVRVLPSAQLEPMSPRLQPGQSLQFRVRMKGLPRDAAVWAVEEAAGGDIGPEGRYTAPRKPGVYHVTAASASDPSAYARATVTVGEN